MQPLTMITNNNNTYTWVTFLSIPIFLFFKQFFSVWSNGGIDDISFSKNKKKVIVYCWSTRKFDIRNKRVVSHCITFTFVLVITLWQNRYRSFLYCDTYDFMTCVHIFRSNHRMIIITKTFIKKNHINTHTWLFP